MCGPQADSCPVLKALWEVGSFIVPISETGSVTHLTVSSVVMPLSEQVVFVFNDLVHLKRQYTESSFAIHYQWTGTCLLMYGHYG